jgi:Fe-S-cluster-containing hydrogenase component 2
MAERNPKIAVLLDRQSGASGYGLDTDEIAERLTRSDSTLIVDCVSGLGANVRSMSEAIIATGAQRVIVGWSGERMSVADVQQTARDAGIDQFGIWPVELGTLSCRVADPEDRLTHAVLTLLGTVERARAYRGSRQQNLRPERLAGVGIESLFSVAELEYRPAPTVRGERCRASYGCRQCVDACPHNALRIGNGQVRLRKRDCTSCGICLTACPTEAINFPTAMPAEIHNQVTCLLDEYWDGPDARGILFVCPNTMRNLASKEFDLSPGWLPVEVPCLGMLTVQWILAPLRLGAGAVGLVPCIDNCRSGQIDQIRQRVSYCQALLREAWDMPEAVQLTPATENGLRAFLADDLEFAGYAFEDEPDCAFRYDARVDVVIDVAAADGADLDWSITHSASPFASVRATDGCTLCGSCVDACPQDALQIVNDGPAETTLTFNSRRCVTCEQCLPACPEIGVLHVDRTTDLALLAEGRATIHRDAVNLCDRCGQPISTNKMMGRIAELLGEEHAGTLNVISRFCTNCRGVMG